MPLTLPEDIALKHLFAALALLGLVAACDEPVGTPASDPLRDSARVRVEPSREAALVVRCSLRDDATAEQRQACDHLRQDRIANRDLPEDGDRTDLLSTEAATPFTPRPNPLSLKNGRTSP